MKAMSRELGEYMSNKEELLEAIEHYDVFTKAQRKILKALIEIEADSKSVISIKSLSDIAGISRTSTYKIIDLLSKDNIIEVLSSPNNKINSFLLKKSRLEEIKEVMQKTKKLVNNKLLKNKLKIS